MIFETHCMEKIYNKNSGLVGEPYESRNLKIKKEIKDVIKGVEVNVHAQIVNYVASFFNPSNVIIDKKLNHEGFDIYVDFVEEEGELVKLIFLNVNDKFNKVDDILHPDFFYHSAIKAAEKEFNKNVEIIQLVVKPKFPDKPAILKSGELSKDKAQATTYDIYYNTILEMKLPLAPYQEFLAYLKENEKVYYDSKRIYVAEGEEKIEFIKKVNEMAMDCHFKVKQIYCEWCEYNKKCWG